MPKEPVSDDDVYTTALRVCTREEIANLPYTSMRILLWSIRRRLREEGPPPKDIELEGLKKLAFRKVLKRTQWIREITLERDAEPKPKPSPEQALDIALRINSRAELQQGTDRSLDDYFELIQIRMQEPGWGPEDDELIRLRDLLVEWQPETPKAVTGDGEISQEVLNKVLLMVYEQPELDRLTHFQYWLQARLVDQHLRRTGRPPTGPELTDIILNSRKV